MEWILTLTMAIGMAQEEKRVGLMVNQQICALAGVSMAATMSMATPGAQFGWRCEKQEAA